MTAPLPPGISIQTVTITGPVNLFNPESITGPILAAIAASTATTGAHMSELDDRLADIQAAEAGQTASLSRLITDFEAAGTARDQGCGGREEQRCADGDEECSQS